MSYTQPLLLLFGMVALFGLVRVRQGKGTRVPMVGILGLMLLCWPPVDWLLSRPLEIWFPVRPYQPEPAQAIVVLAQGMELPKYERPYALPDHETYSRCKFAAWLYKHRQALPILACGGGAKGEDGVSTLAASMRELLQESGIPEAMIWTEERSNNTHENAVYGAEVLRTHGVSRIVLVVDGQSMLRAAACFRKTGIGVVPAPSRFRQLGHLFDELLPSWKAISRNEITLHEAVGFAWYRLRGWI